MVIPSPSTGEGKGEGEIAAEIADKKLEK